MLPKFSLPGWIRLTSRWHDSKKKKKKESVGKKWISFSLFLPLPLSRFLSLFISFALIGAWTRTNSEQMFNFDRDECVFHFSISSFLLPAIGVFRIYLCKWNEHMPGCGTGICKVTKPSYIFSYTYFRAGDRPMSRFSKPRNDYFNLSFDYDCVTFVISISKENFVFKFFFFFLIFLLYCNFTNIERRFEQNIDFFEIDTKESSLSRFNYIIYY